MLWDGGADHLSNTYLVPRAFHGTSLNLYSDPPPQAFLPQATAGEELRHRQVTVCLKPLVLQQRDPHPDPSTSAPPVRRRSTLSLEMSSDAGQFFSL